MVVDLGLNIIGIGLYYHLASGCQNNAVLAKSGSLADAGAHRHQENCKEKVIQHSGMVNWRLWVMLGRIPSGIQQRL